MTINHYDEPEINWIIAIMTYFSYALLVMVIFVRFSYKLLHVSHVLPMFRCKVGHIRDFFAKLTGYSRYFNEKSSKKKGYAELFKDWESFFTRRLFHRAQDCGHRPVACAPGVRFQVMERVSYDNNYSLQTTGKILNCLNFGSYNYLGFADDWHQTCQNEVLLALDVWPISMCSSRMDFGTTAIHHKLEMMVARFVGKERAVVYSMRYGTDTATIAALGTAGSLIISASDNHNSIVNGARASQAHIHVFRTNDVSHLEQVLREALAHGQPGYTPRRPWTKIWVIVEGVYIRAVFD